MENRLRIAVVVVTFNGARWISDCLTSVLNSNVSCTIIVVDNCSTDDTAALVSSSFPNVILIRNTKNEGFGQANNVGIVHALRMKADYVFLLNQDTTVQADTIGLLVDSFERNQNQFAVISPVHLSDKGSELDGGFRRFLDKSLSSAEINRLMNDIGDEIFDVDFVNAAAWMIPAAVFQRVGGFAPLFFHYGEDRDFVSRIRSQGYKVGVVSRASIRHYRGYRVPVTGWSFQRKIHYYYVNCLSRTADINRGFLPAFFSGLVWVCKESLFYLIKGKPSIMAASMVAMGRVIRTLPEIISHRETVGRAGEAHFLEIDRLANSTL